MNKLNKKIDCKFYYPINKIEQKTEDNCIWYRDNCKQRICVYELKNSKNMRLKFKWQH